jgi:hypothetical protein
MEAININHLQSMAEAAIRSCDQIELLLRNIKQQWHEAPYFLTSIMESCESILGTMTQFRDRLRGELGVRLDVLHSFLSSFQKVLNLVETSAREIQPGGNHTEDRNLWKRFRVAVPDSALRNCSRELDKQNSFVKGLAAVLKL